MGLISYLKQMSSKITNQHTLECIKNMREKTKDRKFKQTVELQVGIKDYDPMKDKRFAGTVTLPNIPRPKMKICFIADEKHSDEAKNANLEAVDVVSLDFLKKFNKDKKLIKTWAKKYKVLLATDSLVKKIPVVCGPFLNRIGMFPAPVTKNDPIQKKIDDVRGSVKWQLKKVTNLNTAIGHQDMTDEQLRANIVMSLNFLASLMKKQWHNMKTINIKMTMGKSVKIL